MLFALIACAARTPPPAVTAESMQAEPPAGPAPLGEVPPPGAIQRYAVAHLDPASGSAVTGLVTFREVEQPPPEPGEPGDIDIPVTPARVVDIVVDVQGADPGTYTFRVHEVGDCGAWDASSAGLVFALHGGTEDIAGRAAGDLGTIEVDPDGHGRAAITTERVSLGGDERSIVGRALVVARPLGGSAERRVACGVIVSEVSTR